jgi:Carboxypeptidase regulatory-like domain
MDAYQCRVSLRRPGSILLAAWLFTAAGLLSRAQSPAMHRDADTPGGTPAAMPDAPALHAAEEPAGGVICGTVLDANGAEVEGATVVLEGAGGREQRGATTDGTGFFRFSSVASGSFKISVTAKGFSDWSSAGLMLHPNEDYDLPPVELRLAMSTTEVAVTFTRRDIAEEEIHAEEKQRVLGAIPNFYVSYSRDPEPLSSGQKYRLAWRTSIDPISIVISAGIAGVEQSQDDFNGYGQGAGGYAKRFGAVYADGLVSTFLADAVFPSVLHQDPRYFYKGTGSIRSRALHAIASVVICKGDNGRWQPNYSNVLGNLAAAGISNVYYPASDREGAELTIRNSLIGTGAGAIGALFQEFLVKRISSGVPH